MSSSSHALSTTLTIVRHGETPANLDGVWHGSTDTPLTDRGQEQARRVGRYLAEKHPEVRSLYASNLQRAHNTARAIGDELQLTPQVDPELAEFHLGEWEGKTYRELMEDYRLWHHMKRDPHYRPHGGESPRMVVDRLVGALRRIHDAHPGERVIVVSHGGALSMAFGMLLDGEYSQWRRMMDNCAVTEMVLAPEPNLLSFNHVEHLEGV